MIRCLNVTFLDELNQVFRADDMTYVIVWGNVSFYHAQMVQAWFQAHPQFTTLYLPALLKAIDDACNDITADQCQAWIRPKILPKMFG